MSDTGWTGDVARQLVSTPNGQIRLLGAAMCVGPGYYILAQGAAVSTFVYVLLGLGAVFIALSAIMEVYAVKKHLKEPGKSEVKSPTSFEPSDRLQKFASEVLSVPHNRDELSKMTFSSYEALDDRQRYGLLMQETSKVCVASGVARIVNGCYLSTSATDGTIILQKEDG